MGIEDFALLENPRVERAGEADLGSSAALAPARVWGRQAGPFLTQPSCTRFQPPEPNTPVEVC